MHLGKHDLLQMDAKWLKKLPAERLLDGSIRLRDDVKEWQDRLNQNPANSSRPPTSQAPWEKPSAGEEEAEGMPAKVPEAATEAMDTADSTEETVPRDVPPPLPPKASDRTAGKQPGSPGHGRTQQLMGTDTCEHRPACCAACGRALATDTPSQAYPAWDEVNMAPPVDGQIRLIFRVTRHQRLEVSCPCGHTTRALPWRAPADSLWDRVGLGEWRLVGPQWAGRIVFLALRMHLSRRRIRERLRELFGLLLSIGVIDETIREAGRASDPLEDALVTEVRQAAEWFVDETSWRERAQWLWLWALVTTHTVVFFIGYRTAEILQNALQDGFDGLLIRDGDRIYRAWENRLRCWAHLMRKLRGLAESSDARVAEVGKEREGLMKTWMAAIDAARIDPPPEGLRSRYAAAIERLRQLGEAHQADDHQGLGSVAREFLSDWKVILRPVDEPHLSLTNNAAEQALRHGVIARDLSHGTRSEEGSRAFALLASVIETCRRREACAWRYVGTVIEAARKGLELPALPAIPVAA